jgi:adenylate cyclase
VTLMAGEPLLRARVRLVLWIIAASVVSSAVYGYLNPSIGAEPLEGVVLSIIIGVLISGILAPLEVVVLNGPRGTAFRQMPFLVHLAVRFGIYLIVIVFGLAIGRWLIEGRLVVQRDSLLFSITVSLVINFVFGVNRLLGQNVLLNFVAGRYHRPRLEDRVLLFIDMEASTRVAEQLGEVRFLLFLNRFIRDVTEAIVGQRGEIHKYVGDELIVTWKVAAGIKDARCIRGCFDALARLDRLAPHYEREFGMRANFRAALHSGPVVIGELGAFKQEIALIGDTMNTTARLQQACRDTGHRVLASADLVDRLAALPSTVAKHSIGMTRLRGKERPLEVYALDATAR